MGSSNNRLTGGICFGIFLAYRNEEAKSKVTKSGKKIGTELLWDFARIINPYINSRVDFSEQSIKDKTSNYKKSIKGSNHIYELDNLEIIKGFDKRIHADYKKELLIMKDITDLLYDNEEKRVAMVRDLIRLIIEDDQIPEDADFYINEDGTPMKKSKLCEIVKSGNEVELFLESFLLGVWHYAIHIPNEYGKDTFCRLWMKDKNGKFKYRGIWIDEEINLKIEIYSISKEDNDDNSASKETDNLAICEKSNDSENETEYLGGLPNNFDENDRIGKIENLDEEYKKAALRYYKMEEAKMSLSKLTKSGTVTVPRKFINDRWLNDNIDQK